MKQRRGFALLAGVWLMVAIAAVGLEVSWLARTRRLTVANALDHARARAAATAGLEHARARLAGALGPARGDALADPWRWATGGDSADLEVAQYAFVMRDDAAAFDVNRVDEPTLMRLFQACGADAVEAAQAAQRIADWRDPDSLRRAHGMERDEYLALGARTLPRNGPVQAVAELDDVAGLPVHAWSCVRPLMQVGGSGLVNPNTAPVEVLAALPGFSPLSARAVAQARQAGGRVRSFPELLAALPPALRGDVSRSSAELQSLLEYQTSEVRVTSVARVPGSPVRVRAESLMRRNGGTVFVEWQEFR
jgi:type II secretory pathway component PulK